MTPTPIETIRNLKGDVVKFCPRCQRIGLVTRRPDAHGSPRFRIAWQAHNGSDVWEPDREMRMDESITLEELLSVSVGCGYDTRRSEK